MSSRARRVSNPSDVSAFDWNWAGGAPTEPRAQAPAAPASAAAPPPAPADDAQVQGRLAALEREAFAQGFAQGERAGAEAAAQRGEAMVRRLTQTLDELTALRSQMIRDTERQMVQLALAVARRVVHREVSLDQDLLIAMARVALDRLGDSAQIEVRLSPEDYEATAAARMTAWSSTSVAVAPDARVPRGGCRIESDFGMVEAGIDAQIQELARALLGEEDVRHGQLV